MGEYLLGAAGIFVSVVLFLFGYRQTVGAKKERVRTANHDVVRIMVRRVVLESCTPNLHDLSILIAGKAQDFRVKTADLMSETQVLTAIYTRVVESDLIPVAQREEILKRIEPVIHETERKPEEEPSIEVPDLFDRLRTSTRALALLGLFASVLGTLVAILPALRTEQLGGGEVATTALLTAASSAIIIAALSVFLRLRSSQEETSADSEKAARLDFERIVAKILAAQGRHDMTLVRGTDVDYLLCRGDRKLAVEVKAWFGPVPNAIVRQSAIRAAAAAERNGADLVVVVTPAPIRIPSDVSGAVRFAGVSGLKRILEEWARPDVSNERTERTA